MAVIGLILPPPAIASAVVVIGFSGVGWRRARQRDEANPVAGSVLLASALLIVLVVVGSSIYAATG
ncbi:MAG: hypothetical protein ABJH68_07120 [Ilumatobacter sp.]|uniref:hypothetical protein n=1 Tax=Ilumatobacter sp. TaxID=1967498 RepID=UPI00329745AC